MVLCVSLVFLGAACGSTSGGGDGGGGLTAADTTGGGSLTGKDSSGADATCSAADNSCKGSKLQYCDNGAFATMNCDEAGCLAAGFLGSAGCGAGPDGTSTCLCTACTAADNVCLSAKVAQVCDTATGTVSSTTCASGKSCAGGKCAAPTCTPKCASGACGPGSDGCGGTCSCSAGEQCNNGTCQKPCTSADNACSGDTLHTCGSDGQLHDQVCSTASCVQAGFIGYAKCGANPGEAATCLCQGCSAADEKCVGATAYACDDASGKLVATACGGGKLCKNATCVSPCVDECTTDNCNAAGQVELCQVGIDGCMKKLLPKACGGGLVCPPGTFTGCGACNDQSQCSAASVCQLFSKCIPASGATYTLKFYSATVPTTDSTGASWDGFGGAPDPIVNVYVNDVFVGSTGAISDTFSPSWNQSVDVVLNAGDVLLFQVWDQDVSSDDYIDGAQFSSWLATVKAGSYHSGPLYAGSTTSMSYDFGPK